MTDAADAQPGSPLFEGGAAYEAYLDHIQQARTQAIDDCIKVVAGQVKYHRDGSEMGVGASVFFSDVLWRLEALKPASSGEK